MRILRGRGLQVWLPERKDHRPDERLHLLRGPMQLLPYLQLQDRLGADIGAAHFPLSLRPSTGPERCAAFLLTRGEKSIMYNHSAVLVAAGSLCLTITLVLAWCLAGVRASTFYEEAVSQLPVPAESPYGLSLDDRSVDDLLFVFAQFHVSASPVILAAMCLGSLGNPVGFLVLAVKPNLRQHPTSPFGAAMTVSFALTTVGYGGAAWSVGRAALLAL